MTPSRRGILAALPCGAIRPPSADNPDAALIRDAAAFIEIERAAEASVQHLAEKPDADWTAADRAAQDASTASATGYHKRLEAISIAEPITPEGLAAQATVMLWHFAGPSDDDAHARNLAESVLRVLGRPMPTWASADGTDAEDRA